MLGNVGRAVVAGKSEQYAAFTLAISFSLMRSRWPVKYFIRHLKYFFRKVLTHDKPVERPLGNNCGASVDGEGGCTVVHCGSVIVVNAVVCDDVSRIYAEVVGGASLNVVPDDVDPLVSFRRRLHVIKSDGVEEFVHNREKTEAPGLQALVAGRLEV